MRIITGFLKGRKMLTPKNLKARPTTDFAKTGLFNVLNNLVEFDGISVLDLFAGTGSISFEFVSRGAAFVTAVDIEAAHCKSIKENADLYSLNQLSVIRRDVFQYLQSANGKYDVIFADPPYDLEEAKQLPDIIMESGLLNEGGFFVLEHGNKTSFEGHPNLFDERKYGSVYFSFFGIEEE